MTFDENAGHWTSADSATLPPAGGPRAEGETPPTMRTLAGDNSETTGPVLDAAESGQCISASPGRANVSARASASTWAPAPKKREGHNRDGTHLRFALAADHAIPDAEAKELTPDPQPHPAKVVAPEGAKEPARARAAKSGTASSMRAPHANNDHGHMFSDLRVEAAVIDDGSGLVSDDAQTESAAPHPLNASPLVAEIVETWRQRQAMVEARKRLILQAKALCRRMTAGDKAAADAIYAAGAPILDPFMEAMAPFGARQAALDKHMVKLAKRLPVADFAAGVKGFGHAGLAKAVGELGDLTCYEKGVAGIWKRAGLAVIDGQRQRRVTGDAALIHGYAPARRSVFWNIAAAMLKGQGTGEAAGPYRLIYDERKAYERSRVETDGHAHNRALRYMTKRLLRELWRAWRDAA